MAHNRTHSSIWNSNGSAYNAIEFEILTAWYRKDFSTMAEIQDDPMSLFPKSQTLATIPPPANDIKARMRARRLAAAKREE